MVKHFKTPLTPATTPRLCRGVVGYLFVTNTSYHRVTNAKPSAPRCKRGAVPQSIVILVVEYCICGAGAPHLPGTRTLNHCNQSRRDDIFVVQPLGQINPVNDEQPTTRTPQEWHLYFSFMPGFQPSYHTIQLYPGLVQPLGQRLKYAGPSGLKYIKPQCGRQNCIYQRPSAQSASSAFYSFAIQAFQ